MQNGGAEKYKTEFIDKIAAHFAKYPKQRIVVFLEPDSLPNLVTNKTKPECAAAEKVYMDSTAYAIQKLSLPNVSIYMDIGHAGWMGWDTNFTPGATLIGNAILGTTKGGKSVDGFISNTANTSVETETYAASSPISRTTTRSTVKTARSSDRPTPVTTSLPMPRS